MIHRHLCVANQCNQVGLDIGYEKINIDEDPVIPINILIKSLN